MKKWIKDKIKSNRILHSVARKVKRSLTKQNIIVESDYDYINHFPDHKEIEMQKNYNFKHNIKISILLPTYNTSQQYLKECIESVINQTYQNWELCIADDNSTDKNVTQLISEYIKIDKRIKLHRRTKNGHISAATNSAAKIATGQYYALLDHDDVLWPNALFEVAKILELHPGTEFIYTDEDKIDETGEKHFYPFFKPDWSPEFLESCNYITHFSCISKTVFDKVGGFRIGYEGAQDWDLILRVTEQTDKIIHIPKVLYSWRVHTGSTALDTDSKPYVYDAQKKLLEDHIKRVGKKGYVEKGIIPQHRTIKYSYGDIKTLFIYSGKNKLSVVRRRIESITNIDNFCIKKAVSMQALIKILHASNDVQVVAFLGETTTFDSQQSDISYLLGDVTREDIGLVGPRIMRKNRKVYISAGQIFKKNFVADSLSGISNFEMTGLRPLFAYSRRNTSSLNSAFFMIKKNDLLKFIESESTDITLDNINIKLSIFTCRSNKRNVYVPKFIAYSKEVSLPEKVKNLPLEKYYSNNFSEKSSNYDY